MVKETKEEELVFMTESEMAVEKTKNNWDYEGDCPFSLDDEYETRLINRMVMNTKKDSGNKVLPASKYDFEEWDVELVDRASWEGDVCCPSELVVNPNIEVL